MHDLAVVFVAGVVNAVAVSVVVVMWSSSPVAVTLVRYMLTRTRLTKVIQTYCFIMIGHFMDELGKQLFTYSYMSD